MSFSRIISGSQKASGSVPAPQTLRHLFDALQQQEIRWDFCSIDPRCGRPYTREWRQSVAQLTPKRAMITCPACGKENEASAHECRRCRAPLRDEPVVENAAERFGATPVGDVCRRCEAFNEPGVTVCSNCGLALTETSPAGEVAVDDRTPPQAFSIEEQPEPEATLSQELRALAISDEEAAEAGLSMDKTPPDPFSIAPPEPPARPAEPAAPADKPCASCGARNPPA